MNGLTTSVLSATTVAFSFALSPLAPSVSSALRMQDGSLAATIATARTWMAPAAASGLGASRRLVLRPRRSRIVRITGVGDVPREGVAAITVRLRGCGAAPGRLSVMPVGAVAISAGFPAGRCVVRTITSSPGATGVWRVTWLGRRVLRLTMSVIGYEAVTPRPPAGSSPPGGNAGPGVGDRFDIGNPVFRDIWVDPVLGSDTQSGSSRAQALGTIAEAWRRVPESTPLPIGYRLQLVSGTYSASSLPSYLEHRWGSYDAPIVFNTPDGAGSAVLTGDLNVFDTRYLYLLGVSINVQGDAFHCEQCSYVLLRDGSFNGNSRAHETIKVNQSDHFMIEDSVVAGAYENAIDFVAVQYGHVRGNDIRDAGDWCGYVKGGSAYLTIAENEIHSCGTGGFTVGQGTGFEFMTSPWLHYEAMDVKVINNVVHDTWGAGLGVNGGFNVLMAYNTMYGVGERSHAAEFVFGGRGCDGDIPACTARIALGGWGSTSAEGDGWIPNKHVYFFNNVVYNPMPYRSQWSHFAIYGPRAVPPGSNFSGLARTDDDLRIVGNIIWNGPASDLDLGVGVGAGCEDVNPTCSAAQLVADNAINTGEPLLRDPGSGDYRPRAGGLVETTNARAIPDFTWSDAPRPPSAPAGRGSNAVPVDRNGAERIGWGSPGAYTVE